MSPHAESNPSSKPLYPLPYNPRYILQDLPVTLPKCKASEEGLDHVAKQLVDRLHDLQEDDLATSVTPIWKDSFALTGLKRTFYHAPSILKPLRATLASRQATNFMFSPGSIRKLALGPDGTGWVDLKFTFTCASAPASNCSGFLSIIPEVDGEWKIWLMRTILDGLEGFPSVDHLDPIPETNGSHTNGTHTNGTHTSDSSTTSTTVLIIGGGQQAISLGGRLNALQVPFLIVDRQANIGDSWRTRYDCAKLHLIREYCHLPFDRTYASDLVNGTEWLTKDQVADGHQRFARRFDVERKVWQSSEVVKGVYDEEKRLYTVDIERYGQIVQVRAKHIVMAVGPGGTRARIPVVPGSDLFKGEALHSVDFKNSKAWKGKKAVVVGMANTAHDVAQDMVANGVSEVTMLQKSQTYMFPASYFANIQRLSFNEQIPTHVADHRGESMPIVVTRLMAMGGLNGQAAVDGKWFDELEEKGFSIARYGDIMWQIYERHGGHYIDMGSCAEILAGRTKVVPGVPVRFAEHGLVVTDGENEREIEADAVVFSTGFEGDLKQDVGRLFGPKVMEKCDPFWGIDEQGEPKGAFKKMKRESQVQGYQLGLS